MDSHTHICDGIAGLVFGYIAGDAVGAPNRYTSGDACISTHTPTHTSERTGVFELVIHYITVTQPISTAGLIDYLTTWATSDFTSPHMERYDMRIFNQLITADVNAREAAVRGISQMDLNLCLSCVAAAGALPIAHAITAAKTLGAAIPGGPNCVTSSILLTGILSSLIYNTPMSSDAVDQLLVSCVKRAQVHTDVSTNQKLSDCIETAYTRSLGELKLGEISRPESVLKCLASAIYVLQVIKVSLSARARAAGSTARISFEKTICAISAQGGDACANASVAGAVLGAYLGRAYVPVLDLLPQINPPSLTDRLCALSTSVVDNNRQ